MNEQLKDVLLEQLKGTAQGTLASKNGLDAATTEITVNSALDAIVSGLKQNVQTKSGAKKLDSALAKDHPGSILGDLAGAISNDTLQADGSKILEHIFGSKTGKVTDEVAKNSGVDTSVAVSILGTLAPIVLEQLGQNKRKDGLSAGDIASTILDQKIPRGGVGDVLSGMLGGNKKNGLMGILLSVLAIFLRKK